MLICFTVCSSVTTGHRSNSSTTVLYPAGQSDKAGYPAKSFCINCQYPPRINTHNGASIQIKQRISIKFVYNNNAKLTIWQISSINI